MPPPDRPHIRSAERLARRKSGDDVAGFRSWARTWLVPPALWEIARRFVRRGNATNKALSPPQNPTPLVNILFPLPGPEPHWIPVEKIVNRYGQSFTTEQHHFVRYLDSGFDDFQSFYRIHQPKTTLQAHFIDEPLPGPAGANVLDVPWQPAPPADTGTRAGKFGAFGPVSDLELAAEAARLDRVLHSLKKYGFFAGHPRDRGGQVGGTVFWKENHDFRIVIGNGNHRTAVLAHLGWDLIPFYDQPGSHPVRLSDLERWPGVVDGRFSREAARTMFEAFFRPRHQQLLPGW